MSFLLPKLRYVSSIEAYLLFLSPRDQAAHIVTPRRQVRMLREPKVECEQHCLSYFRAASAAVGRPVEMRHMTSMMKTMRPRWQNRQQDWRSWRKMWVNSRENKICATTWWPRFCTTSPKRAVRQARCRIQYALWSIEDWMHPELLYSRLLCWPCSRNGTRKPAMQGMLRLANRWSQAW